MSNLRNKIKTRIAEATYNFNPDEVSIDKVVDKLDQDDVVKLTNEDNVDEVNQEVLDKFIKQYGKEQGEKIYYATANKQDRDPDTFHTENEDMEGMEMGFNPASGEEMSWDDLMAAADNGELPISKDDLMGESVRPKMTKEALTEFVTGMKPTPVKTIKKKDLK